MIEGLLLAVFVIAAANLFAAIRTMRSSLRSEGLGESRSELLRDQQDRLELLREERRTLIEELERESQERRQLLGHLEGRHQQLAENREYQPQVERQEQERSRLKQELQTLQESLERERREHSENQQAVEQLEREHEDGLTQARQEAERSGQERRRLAEALEGSVRSESRPNNGPNSKSRNWPALGKSLSGRRQGPIAGSVRPPAKGSPHRKKTARGGADPSW